MNWEKATQKDQYTLSDIFTNNYQIWFSFSLIAFLLSPIVNLIEYIALFQEEITGQGALDYYVSGYYPFDYKFAINSLAMLVGTICLVVGLISCVIYRKKYAVKKIDFNITTICFLSVVFLILTSVLYNGIDRNMIFGYTIRGEGLLNFLYYFLVCYLAGSFITKEKIKKYIIAVFLFYDVVINALTVIDTYTGCIYFFNYSAFGATAMFYNCNFYGYFLSIATMITAALFVLEKKKIIKAIYFVLFLLNSFIINLCNTLGSFLACIVAFFFLLIAISVRDGKISKSVIFTFICLLTVNAIAGYWHYDYYSGIVGLFSDVQDIVENSEDAFHAGTNRWDLWTNCVKLIKQRPWIGWGQEGICETLKEITESHQDIPHNEYLEIAGYYGIPCAVIYILGLMFVYFRGIRRKVHLDNTTLVCMAGAFGYIGSAFFGNTIYFTAPFFFIFLGLSITHEKKDYKKDFESKQNAEYTENFARSIMSNVFELQPVNAENMGDGIE